MRPTPFDFIILPELRFIFCHIEKVAGTQFQRFFQELQMAVGPKVPYKPYYLHGTLHHRTVRLRALTEHLADPTWYKAVFVREPVERFLSGLASKCSLDLGSGQRTRRPRDWDGRKHCRRAFGNDTVTLRGAVERLRTGELVRDRHWKAQHAFCGGLEGTLHHYQAVEVLSSATVNSRVRNMLHALPALASNGTLLERAGRILDKHLPPVSVAATKGPPGHSRHHTNAGAIAQKAFAREPDGDILLTDIVVHYLRDYLLFGLPVPWWARRHMQLERRVRWDGAPQKREGRDVQGGGI